jgi:hypothetical protein
METLVKRSFAVALAAIFTIGVAACSVSSMTGVDSEFTASDSVVVTGPLRFSLKDFLATPGVLWALPSITPQTGAIVVENTRYGSMCIYAVTASADVSGRRVGLHVRYSQRLTSCTAEIRAIRYQATLSLPAGSYDVAVIHEENGSTDTLRKETVTVR